MSQRICDGSNKRKSHTLTHAQCVLKFKRSPSDYLFVFSPSTTNKINRIACIFTEKGAREWGGDRARAREIDKITRTQTYIWDRWNRTVKNEWENRKEKDHPHTIILTADRIGIAYKLQMVLVYVLILKYSHHRVSFANDMRVPSASC